MRGVGKERKGEGQVVKGLGGWGGVGMGHRSYVTNDIVRKKIINFDKTRFQIIIGHSLDPTTCAGI